MPELPWWTTAVVYQVYPRSFADGNGDGVGDLHGLIGRLDHLVWLGVDAVWLSPIYPSPMDDFGYDISDYCDVDPLFGDLATFDRLVAEAHARGIRVILDWVANHTSDRHPWFVASRSSRDDPKRAWYVWRDGTGSTGPGDPGAPPTNWLAAFPPGDRAWQWDPTTGQWYLRLFLASQPDLDWDQPQVRSAMHDTLRFWLDRGVDGFRMDVVHLLGKDLVDDPPDWVAAGLPHVPMNDAERTHDRLREIRAVLEEYPGERMSVGEVYLLDTARMARYVRPGELHLSFNFPFLWTPWDAAALRVRIDDQIEHLDPIGAWPTWVLSNHDVTRHRQRHGGSEASARAAAVLLLTLRGTPFLYQGEELGLVDAAVPPERQVDPGGRDGCRAPVPWEPGDGHGWATDPWLPFPPEAGPRSVEAQRADAGSILHLYRDLLALRRASAALHAGTFSWLADLPADVLGWERVDAASGTRCWVLVRVGGDAPVAVSLPGRAEVLLGTGPGAVRGEPFAGTLRPDDAVVLRPC